MPLPRIQVPPCKPRQNAVAQWVTVERGIAPPPAVPHDRFGNFLPPSTQCVDCRDPDCCARADHTRGTAGSYTTGRLPPDHLTQGLLDGADKPCTVGIEYKQWSWDFRGKALHG